MTTKHKKAHLMNEKEIVKVDKLTRKIVKTYASLQEAATAEDLSVQRIYKACKKKILHRGRFYFRYADEFDPNESFKGKINCPIIFIDTETGKTRWYPSMRNCADQTGFTREEITSTKVKNTRLLGQYAVKSMPFPLCNQEQK